MDKKIVFTVITLWLFSLTVTGDTDVELVPVKYVVKRAASTTTSRPRSTTRPTTTTSRSKTITRSTTRSRPRPTSKPTAVSCYTCTYTKLKNGEEVNTACKNQTGTSRTVGLTHDCTTGCFKFKGKTSNGDKIIVRNCYKNFVDSVSDTQGNVCPNRKDKTYRIGGQKFEGKSYCCDRSKCNTSTSVSTPNALLLAIFLLNFGMKWF